VARWVALALPDQRAFGHQGTADTAADWRAHVGVVEIELGARDLRLARRDIGLRLAIRRHGDLALSLGCSLPGRKFLDSRGV
jgi:hypothetical protein